jgi:hypothetical protein
MAEIPSTTAAKVVKTFGEQLESAARCMIERLEQSGSVTQELIRDPITAAYAFVSDVASSRPLADLSVITHQDYHLAVRRWKATGTLDQAISSMARRLQWFDQVVDHPVWPDLADGPCFGDPNAEVAQ